MSEVVFDLETGTLRCGDKEVFLTPREAQLFGLLERHLGQTVLWERLVSAMFPAGAVTESDPKKLIEVHAAHLRRKLRGMPRRILTQWGYGYRMVKG